MWFLGGCGEARNAVIYPAIPPNWTAVFGQVERCRLVECIEEQTNINYATYQRAWPTQQRDLLNLCHAQQLVAGEAGCAEAEDGQWMAVTISVPHPAVPEDASNTVRMNNKTGIRVKTEFEPGCACPLCLQWHNGALCCAVRCYAGGAGSSLAVVRPRVAAKPTCVRAYVYQAVRPNFYAHGAEYVHAMPRAWCVVRGAWCVVCGCAGTTRPAQTGA